MTTSDIARQPKGVPTGGQFAATSHSESIVSLASRGRPELDGWPENLPEPDLSIKVDDDGKIITVVGVDGHGSMKIWTDNPSTGRTDNEMLGSDFVHDNEDTIEQAFTWGSRKHLDIEEGVRAEMEAAALRSSTAIIARATGKTTPAGDQQLEAIIDDSAEQLSRAEKNVELASVALMSRKIQERYPLASRLALEVDGSEDGTWISAVAVLDRNGDVIGSYDEADEDADEEVLGLARNLNASADNAHWSTFSIRAEGFNPASFQEDSYTINLHRAARWQPGGEA